MNLILEVFRDWSDKPFVWGVTDCLSFAAMTRPLGADDPTAEIRKLYRSEAGAVKVMAKNGWKNMGDVLASILPEKPKPFAQTGDWAEILNEDGTTTVGVIVGHRACAKSMTGTEQVSMDRVRRVFDC